MSHANIHSRMKKTKNKTHSCLPWSSFLYACSRVRPSCRRHLCREWCESKRRHKGLWTLVEAARVFAPLRVGEHKKKKRTEKRRKDINNTRGIQRLIRFSADTSDLINSRISQVVVIYRRQSPGANIVLEWSKVFGSGARLWIELCVRHLPLRRGGKRSKELNTNTSFSLFWFLSVIANYTLTRLFLKKYKRKGKKKKNA